MNYLFFHVHDINADKGRTSYSKWYKFSNSICGDCSSHCTDIYTGVLGQLPTGDNSPPDKNKSHILPTRTTIPRTIPHQDNCPLRPLQTSKTTHQDQYLYGGELSSYDTLVFSPHVKMFCDLKLNQRLNRDESRFEKKVGGYFYWRNTCNWLHFIN